MEPIRSISVHVLVFLVRGYQSTLRPLFGGHCRFAPSCSNYAVEALRTHGLFRGIRLAAGRLLRCHPAGGSGFDPVPPPNGLTGGQGDS
jgi:hypothetical protein